MVRATIDSYMHKSGGYFYNPIPIVGLGPYEFFLHVQFFFLLLLTVRVFEGYN